LSGKPEDVGKFDSCREKSVPGIDLDFAHQFYLSNHLLLKLLRHEMASRMLMRRYKTSHSLTYLTISRKSVEEFNGDPDSVFDRSVYPDRSFQAVSWQVT